MKKSLIINYRFDTSDVEPLTTELEAVLTEAALERSIAMHNDGYIAGELCCVDSLTETEIRGWWEVSNV